MDWKEILLKQKSALGIDDTAETEETQQTESEDTSYLSQPLHIVMERKGRGGKTATIIEGFACSAERLRDIAASLKKSLGTGGSTRGSEILIQGDRREEAARQLRDMGFKVKL